jgi:hypothetical protein
LYVTEEVSYEQVVEVDDSFDLDADNIGILLDELWCEVQDLDGSFVSVDERSVSAEKEEDV